MEKRDGVKIAIIAGLFALAAAALGPWVTAQLETREAAVDGPDGGPSEPLPRPGRDELARRLIFGSWRSPDEACEYARQLSVRDGKIEIRYKGELKDSFSLDTVSETAVTAHNADSRRSFTVDGDQLVYDNGSQSVRMEECP